MMSGRKWVVLAEVTMKFLVMAKEYNFCIDLVDEIERRLFARSPFSIHHKGGKTK